MKALWCPHVCNWSCLEYGTLVHHKLRKHNCCRWLGTQNCGVFTLPFEMYDFSCQWNMLTCKTRRCLRVTGVQFISFQWPSFLEMDQFSLTTEAISLLTRNLFDNKWYCWPPPSNLVLFRGYPYSVALGLDHYWNALWGFQPIFYMFVLTLRVTPNQLRLLCVRLFLNHSFARLGVHGLSLN